MQSSRRHRKVQKFQTVMKQPASLLLVLLFAIFALLRLFADGVFVAPKFVWDKHRDINEPTQKAILVFDAGREDLILQVKYEGSVAEFGWLIPVPHEPTVQIGSMKPFYELSQFTQRHFEPLDYEPRGASLGLASAGRGEPEPPVKVIEVKTVGAYEIAVLSANDTGALANWLNTNQFYFPTNKTGVLDSYIKQHWDFVAAKINLQSRMLPLSTARDLSRGELNPLHITFANDCCVFPLAISSVNDKPSEVQAYVLSTEPLIERKLLTQRLPEIYSDDLARAKQSAMQQQQMLANHRLMQMRFMGGSAAAPTAAPPLPPEYQKAIEKASQTPVANHEDLPPYAKVTEKDLPETTKCIPRLAGKSWWLTKLTRMFQPEEMRDLIFEPSFSVYSDLLRTRYGYFGIAGLCRFQNDAVPALLAAFQSTNPVVRANTAFMFNQGYEAIHDSRLSDAAVNWLTDPEPEIRTSAVVLLTEYGNWQPKYAQSVVLLLRDPDPGVRHVVASTIPRFRGDLEKYIPAIQEMLKDTNAETRAVSLELLDRLGIKAEISRADLLSFFTSSDYEALNAAFSQLGGGHGEISGDEALVMLQSPQIVARLLGLNALAHKPERQSVELALPLLRDPDEMVRLRAAQTLRTLTGQDFSADQPKQWLDWWAENKPNFTAPVPPGGESGLPSGLEYHVRGCEQYNARHFPEALANFRRSCQLGSDAQDYSWFRIWLIRARAGEKAAATQELVSYLKQRRASDPPDWPLQIGSFLAGKISEDDLIKAAADMGSKTGREQHCEAYFYAGSVRLTANDKSGAADLFRKCLGTGVTTFEEFQSAMAELEALP